MTLHVTQHGLGYPLVLCHGWGFDGQIWSSLIPHLSKYTVYLVDLPGFGESDYLDWNTFKDQLLDRLPEHFALLGWSMGGLYATRLAIEASSRVTHLLNVATSPRFVAEADWPGIDPLVLRQFCQQLEQDHQKTVEQFTQAQQISTEHARIKKYNPIGLREGLAVLVNWDLRSQLHEITAKVGYFFGRLDGITRRETLSVMQTLYPEFAYTLFPRAAHTPFLSHPSDFISALNEFMQ